MTHDETQVGFADLQLSDSLLKALDDQGYETPSSIQAQTIPLLLEGRDVVGQAQTGTGKTAAFALPALQRLDLERREPQILVLVPTRELAIQVGESFKNYAAHLQGFQVLPVYGGQSYDKQIGPLRRGVHAVVGTPGRIMDHLRRGTLDLGTVRSIVLDEADEMLRMGFVDDVDWILSHSSSERQTALFSATMPSAVRSIAERHLREPQDVRSELRGAVGSQIRQRYVETQGISKIDALTSLLETEETEGVIIFARTKLATVEVSAGLQARGYDCAPLNGDIPQKHREKTVEQLRDGVLDIIVATDVAARGLDVERITHVFNFDIPHDGEAYVHRIGRTGRAGRTGEAILFVGRRDRRMLRIIERSIGSPVEKMKLPTVDAINELRVRRFKERLVLAAVESGLDPYREVISACAEESSLPVEDLAAALVKLCHPGQPLFLPPRKESAPQDPTGGWEGDRASRRPRRQGPPPQGMERYRIEVGHDHGVQPGAIVGAIANEAGLRGNNIGSIQIFDDHSTVDLPVGMPRHVFQVLQRVRVRQQPLRISRLGGGPRGGFGGGPRGGFDGPPQRFEGRPPKKFEGRGPKRPARSRPGDARGASGKPPRRAPRFR